MTAATERPARVASHGPGQPSRPAHHVPRRWLRVRHLGRRGDDRDWRRRAVGRGCPRRTAPRPVHGPDGDQIEAVELVTARGERLRLTRGDDAEHR